MPENGFFIILRSFLTTKYIYMFFNNLIVGGKIEAQLIGLGIGFQNYIKHFLTLVEVNM